MVAERTIRKHVAIIHAYSQMSVLQRKIFNALLHEATQSTQLTTHPHSVAVECRMPFSKLCQAVKFNSNNTQYLKESVDELASLTIEWNLLKDKAPADISFLNLRVLHGSPTFYQDHMLNFSFHKMMLNLVDNPSIYGTLDMELQADFESKYAHALYESGTRLLNLQKNKIIALDIFRKILGVAENKYDSMRELTRNVVTPSIEEVNDRTDFVVDLTPLKQGRKIIGYEVSVNPKTQKELPVISNQKIHDDIRQTFGVINERVLKNIFQHYSEEYIFEKIAYTKKYAKPEKSGLYPIPYFISAIKHDYHFKEEVPTVVLSSPDSEWKKSLYLLKSDLQHWEKLLIHAQKNNHEAQIKNIQRVILKCQEKLAQHELNQSEQEVEA